MTSFSDIPLPGSLQKGGNLRSSNPLKAVWREIEKLGTIDNQAAIAKRRNHSEDLAKPASMKIRQAIELWRVSQDASILTRPLLLYYSMLNLSRGIMLTVFGNFGAFYHGLSFKPRAGLLDCKAKVTRSGTFRTLAESLGVTESNIEGCSYSLRDLFSLIPEMVLDFHLLSCGESSIARVYVKPYVTGKVKFTYDLKDIDDNLFADHWKTMFPWFKDICNYESSKTLVLKEKLKDEREISEICRKYLIQDLKFQHDGLWYDHRVGNDVILLPQLLAYIAAMFILSNAVRYEPEFLEEPTTGLNNLGFFLESFLDNAERFFPQLIVELLRGPVFFE